VKQVRLTLVAILVLLIGSAVPVAAITYGEPDAGEHPYVGFMVFFDPSVPGWFRCSGTLLDATTFLTAGHCTFGIGTNGTAAGTSGGNDVWVTFDETDVLAGFPPRASLTPEQLYPVRAEWLNNNASYVRGTAFPHPDYDNFSGFPVTFDVGVVELGESAGVSAFGVLASLGTAEVLAAVPAQRNSALIETVGYGIQSVQPHPMEIASRYKSTSRIVEVNGSISAGGNLHTLNNPSDVGGRGGACFGDSGGPLFVNNTNQIVAVVSFGFNPICHGATYSWRVDTQVSQDFILPFVGD
jgi:hypothetical protein